MRSSSFCKCKVLLLYTSRNLTAWPGFPGLLSIWQSSVFCCCSCVQPGLPYLPRSWTVSSLPTSKPLGIVAIFTKWVGSEFKKKNIGNYNLFFFKGHARDPLIWFFSVFLFPGCILETHLALRSLFTEGMSGNVTQHNQRSSCLKLVLILFCAHLGFSHEGWDLVSIQGYQLNTYTLFSLVKLFCDSTETKAKFQGKKISVKITVTGRKGWECPFHLPFWVPEAAWKKLFLLKVKATPVGGRTK